VTGASPLFGYCVSVQNTFSNFIYQINMTIVKGDSAGIVFRRQHGTDVFLFYYATISLDGTYGIFYKNSKGGPDLKLAGGYSPSINKDQGNKLAIVAQGTDLDLYINGHFVVHVTDANRASGEIGVIAMPVNTPTEATFSHVELWSL
jgi:hypothetical protein